MRLNHDCIRAIMLYIEENTDDENECVSIDDLLDILNDYDLNTINYHIRKLHSANLVEDVVYADGGILDVSCLSWDGHEYLDNIRDQTAWDMVKKGSIDLSSMSLNLVGQLSKEILFSYAKKKLGI